MAAIEDFLADAKRRMYRSIEATHQEFNSIRTGRASPALLDRVTIDYYGTPTPLKSLASIGAPEARLLTRSIEGSNVTATSALVEMIEASRSWDTQLKMISDVRDMDSATASLMQLPR